MDISTFPHSRLYSPPAPMIEIELWREGRTRLSIHIKALLDSGSDGTLLPLEALNRVGARPVGARRIRSLLGELEEAELYLVNLNIGEITLPAIQVVALPDNSEAIIGRNVLNHLIVTLNGPAQVTEVSQ